jgi:hypothetical protein
MSISLFGASGIIARKLYFYGNSKDNLQKEAVNVIFKGESSPRG